MPTHQEIAGISDEMLVQRMISSHDQRFDQLFWHHFSNHIGPHLGEEFTAADIGCGPGLLLRDLSERFPAAELHGIDVTQAMLDYGEGLNYAGSKPVYHQLDLTTSALPFDDDSVNLLTMVAVLHVLPDPLAALQEISRVLSPGGVFMLYDWFRRPLSVYMQRMAGDAPPDQAELARQRTLRLFADHNKYTEEDWRWLLQEAGFTVASCNQVTSPHFLLWTLS